jgi:hypothetical protein
MKFVEEVKDHALQHYEEDGWDIVVECYSDDEIANIIRGCSTKKEAIWAVLGHVTPYYKFQQEVRAEAF